MTKKEAIDNAYERYSDWINKRMTTHVATRYVRDELIVEDRHELADAYTIGRQRQESDCQRPTREQFTALGADHYHNGTLWLKEAIWWPREMDYPCIFLSRGMTVEIKTVEQLRVMCEMLGIDTKGVI